MVVFEQNIAITMKWHCQRFRYPSAKSWIHCISFLEFWNSTFSLLYSSTYIAVSLRSTYYPSICNQLSWISNACAPFFPFFPFSFRHNFPALPCPSLFTDCVKKCNYFMALVQFLLSSILKKHCKIAVTITATHPLILAGTFHWIVLIHNVHLTTRQKEILTRCLSSRFPLLEETRRINILARHWLSISRSQWP